MATVFKVRTLLVDCDLKKPSLHRILNQASSPGLVDVIDSPEKLESAIQQTAVKNLYLLTAGGLESQTVFADESIRSILRAALADYDLAICDVPSIGSQPHAISTLSLMDRVLVVIDSQKISSRELGYHRTLMSRRGIPISAVVMNRSRPNPRSIGS